MSHQENSHQSTPTWPLQMHICQWWSNNPLWSQEAEYRLNTLLKCSYLYIVHSSYFEANILLNDSSSVNKILSLDTYVTYTWETRLKSVFYAVSTTTRLMYHKPCGKNGAAAYFPYHSYFLWKHSIMIPGI